MKNHIQIAKILAVRLYGNAVLSGWGRLYQGNFYKLHREDL